MIDLEQVESFIEENFNVTITLSYVKYINGIRVDAIIVPPESRGKGVGSQVFEYLTRLADKLDMTMVLTPSKDLGATSIERLRKFYKKFGFVRNLGKHKEYKTKEAMIRYPKK